MTFLGLDGYKFLAAWMQRIRERPAVRRGMKVNRCVCVCVCVRERERERERER